MPLKNSKKFQHRNFFDQLKEESVWLTQEQIATLFGTQRPAITKHLNNIFNSGELDRTSTCSILEHMGNFTSDFNN